MKICYFGIFDPSYSRNRIFIKGLKLNNALVIECISNKKGITKYIDLIKKHWRIRNDYEVMIVGFAGQQATILARFLTRKPIIFDALTSLYDSLVYDRKTVKRNSFGALYFWFIDWLACRLANEVVCDTKAHADYFSQNFHIKRSKFQHIYIGSDDDAVKPLNKKEKNNSNFTVHFHGFFNPLQGVPYIINAAKILEKDNVKFNIIGSGQGYDNIVKLAHDIKANNVSFIPPVPYEKLREYMGQADVCLGVFGDSDKTRRVISNKVYEALATRMPLITSRTEAIEELLTDKKNVLLCKVSSSADLAYKILELKNNPDLKTKIADNGYELFLTKLRPSVIGKELLNLAESIIKK